MSHKILLVGQPSCRLDALAALLYGAGMAAARPSRREGLTPAQIDATLRQVHGVTGTGQLQIGPVWQGLALDLLMANLDQPTWGWHDADALPLLDFWCSVDPDVRVVLAYDHPDCVLTTLPADQALTLTPTALNQRLDDWSAYQEAALHFAYRHRDRCLLVHAGAVLQAPQTLLDPQGPLARLAPTDWAVPLGAQAPASEAGAALTNWLVRTPVEASARAIAVYEECQAVADLPATAEAAAVQPIDVTDSPSGDWRSAWQAWAEHRVQQLQRDAELGRRAAAIAALEQQALLCEQALLAELTQLRAEQRQQADAAYAQLDVIGTERDAVRTERDLALSERDGARTDRDAALGERDATRARLEASQEARAREAAAARAKLEQAQDEAASLLAQLHRVQESYETLHCARQRDTDAHALSQTQLHHARAEAQAQMRQAEAAAQALRSERDTLQRRLTDAEQHGADLQRQVQFLTTQVDTLNSSATRSAIERQAHTAREAAQRAELETEVRHAEQDKNLLLSQLHRVQEALERLHLERPAAPARPRPPVPYGAADRVKQQLSYRLGAKMIEQSGSIGGWLSMPWALKRVHKAYQAERDVHAGKKRPPLHTYGDAQEADRVRKHLSYRLGHALVTHGQHPMGWLTLPFAVGREVKAYRRDREQVAA